MICLPDNLDCFVVLYESLVVSGCHCSGTFTMLVDLYEPQTQKAGKLHPLGQTQTTSWKYAHKFVSRSSLSSPLRPVYSGEHAYSRDF